MIVTVLATSATAQYATRPEFPNRERSGVKYEHFTKAAWDASNFATPERMQTWQDRRYGMFMVLNEL